MNLIGEVLELLGEEFLPDRISDVCMDNEGLPNIEVSHYLGGITSFTFYPDSGSVCISHNGDDSLIFPEVSTIVRVAWILGNIEGTLQQKNLQ
jgi:hypothetical protein